MKKNNTSVFSGAVAGGLVIATINTIKKMVEQAMGSDESKSKVVQSSSGETIIPSAPRLLELTPRGFGDAYAIPEKRKVVVGRSATGREKPDVGLSVPAVVSRRHFEVSGAKNSSSMEYTIKPIAENNVTTLNGRVIEANVAVPLRDGDVIGLSADGYYYIFRCTDTPINALPLFTETDRFLGV